MSKYSLCTAIPPLLLTGLQVSRGRNVCDPLEKKTDLLVFRRRSGGGLADVTYISKKGGENISRLDSALFKTKNCNIFRFFWRVGKKHKNPRGGGAKGQMRKSRDQDQLFSRPTLRLFSVPIFVDTGPDVLKEMKKSWDRDSWGLMLVQTGLHLQIVTPAWRTLEQYTNKKGERGMWSIIQFAARIAGPQLPPQKVPMLPLQKYCENIIEEKLHLHLHSISGSKLMLYFFFTNTV